MVYYSFAKINLGLDIIGRDENGYHLIETVFQTIPVFDEISIDQTEGSGEFNVRFRGEESKLINPEDNTVVKAIQTLNKNWEFKYNYKIVIFKQIPLGAGLGGGSSNAAIILKALNELEGIGLSNEDLRNLAAKIGMDAPYFIESGTAIGTHYGEKIEPLPPLDNLPGWVEKKKLLVIPGLRKNTEDMYKKVEIEKTGKNAEKTDTLIEAIKAHKTNEVIANMHNDFELFSGEGFNKIKDILVKNGANQAVLCGSGTTVFAISNNSFDLKALSQELPNLRILSLNQ